jgi:hypothetical protein
MHPIKVLRGNTTINLGQVVPPFGWFMRTIQHWRVMTDFRAWRPLRCDYFDLSVVGHVHCRNSCKIYLKVFSLQVKPSIKIPVHT